MMMKLKIDYLVLNVSNNEQENVFEVVQVPWVNLPAFDEIKIAGSDDDLNKIDHDKVIVFLMKHTTTDYPKPEYIISICFRSDYSSDELFLRTANAAVWFVRYA